MLGHSFGEGKLMHDEQRVTVLVVVLAAIGAAIASLGVWHDKKSDQPVAATEVQVRQQVCEAVSLAPDLLIDEQPAPIINRAPGDKVLTYLVESKLTNEYWFKVKDYQLDYAGDWAKINFTALEEAIDHAYVKRSSFPQELTAAVNLGLPNGVFGISVGGPLKPLLEFAGIVQGVTKLNVDHVDIAIKGYADGEVSAGWAPPRKDLGPQFQKFSVLNPERPELSNPMFYTREPVPREVAQFYKNDDLPDLRAQFVRTEFVEQFVPKLANGDRCHVYVLHNRALADPGQEQWRKAQIYVMVYLKRDA